VDDFLHAAEEGDAEDLREMLQHYERKFSVNYLDQAGYSALHYAASAGKASVRALARLNGEPGAL
jgi:ankyrin repeat protein